MNNEESDKKTDVNVCVNSTATAKNSKNKNSHSGSVGVGNCNSSCSSSNSGSSTGRSNANGKNMSTTKSTMAAAQSTKSSTSLTSAATTANCATLHHHQQQHQQQQQHHQQQQQHHHPLAAAVAAAVAATANSSSSSSSSSSTSAAAAAAAAVVASTSLQNQTLENLVSNCKLTSSTSSPTKSDTDTFSELQPRVTDLSESDEESVSEDEIHDSGSESCGNDVEGNDDEDDGDDEDEDEDDEVRGANDVGGNFLLDATSEHHSKKLTALFEAAANDKAPVLRHATLAIDEATQALTKMRSANSPREKTIFSRTLIAACTDNDVNTVRRLLGKGNVSINESTDDGESLLSMACSAGYFELAQVLLAMSAAQVEDKGQKDCTPLMEAASAGHVDIIRLLISHKADVNASCTTGNTPLMFACAGGHVEAVKELLRHGANVEDQNENGHTPLMEAASAGHVEVAKVLLEHGAGINTHSNEFKESALTLACYKGHLNMVRFLLQAGADQEHKTDEMHTALMEASMDGHVEVARLLLDSGAQVNMPTDSFESPLTLAACGGHVELATLLIERGANIEEVNDEGYTPLMEAAREGHEDMVALLLAKGANINATTEETQETALTLACCGGFMEVAEFLIKQGADLELGASTPLMEAAQEGHTDLVRFLLENGANVHAQTQTGDTALTHACENGHTDAAEVLLYYGAELEHESEGGRTPLMKACRAGHICTVKFLISKGADVNKQTTSNDHTALSLACAGGNQAVVELLLKSGADPFHKLKDNSTMLIEASKGGHIRVVETLFKYPHFTLNHPGDATTSTTINNNTSQIQQQQQPINLQHQKQIHQQLQQLSAPPGLHEVPEAVRVSNQQIFHQQPFQSMEYLDDQMIANTSEGFAIDPNARNTQLQNDPFFAKMRLIQLQAGLEDGLAHGLARAQPGVVNQIINQSNNCSSPNTANIQTNINTTSNNVNNANQNITNITKQKSLLRKNRQAPAPFELNLTSSEAQQVRSQPLGEDDSSIYVNTNMTASEEQQQQRRKIIEEFQKLDNSFQKANIQLVCDGNGPPSTLLPSAYVDITTASAQGAKAGDTNNSFLLTTTSLPTLQNTTTSTSAGGASVLSQQFLSAIHPISNTISTSTTTATSTTPTSTTHITTPSEVSQSTAISDRPKVKPVSKKDGKNLRKAATVLQQNQMVSIYNNLPLLLATEPSYQTHHPTVHTTTILSGGQSIIKDPPNFQQTLDQLPSPDIFQQAREMATLSTSSDSASSSAASSSVDPEDDVTKLANSQWNRKMLQMVSQMPHHPIQKIAHRLIVDQPKSPTETPPICDSDKTPDSPTKNSTFISQHEDHFHMFPVDSDEAIGDCSIYPAITDTLDPFSEDDNVREQCSYELSDCMEEILNVFQGDPTLQEIATNLNCPEFAAEYGLNALCKNRWSGQWVSPQQSQEQDLLRANFCLTEDPNDQGLANQIILDQKLMQQMQNRFSVEDLQIISQFQNNQHQQTTLSLIPTSTLEHQVPPNIGIQPLPTQTVQGASTGIQQQQQNQHLLQQQQQGLSGDAQQQTKFVFNVDTDKPSQSLQLLFQLPPVEAPRQTTTILTGRTDQPQPSTSQQITSQAIAQTQTAAVCQPVQTQLTQTNINLQQLSQQHCAQHSQQVQVATQTQQQPPSACGMMSSSMPAVSQFCTSIPTSVDGTSIPSQQPSTSTGKSSASGTGVTKKTIDKLSRKERNRYTVMRQAPAGSQANTTQQYTPPGTTPSTDKTIDVDSETDSNHDTALTLACAGGHEELVDLLINRGANIEHRDKKGFTPLILAASAGHEKVVDILLNHNADLEAQLERTKDTPLSLACSGGRYEVVEVLLTAGANKEHRNVSDYTPLSLAASGGYVNIIKLLLSHGAEINSRTGSKLGISPLMLAAMNGHTAAVKLLLDMGSDINAQIETNRNTALTLACFQGRHEVVNLLLERKANVEHRAKTGLTPLMEAASGGYIEVGRVLLDKGADVNAAPVPTSRDTALTIAADKGHLKFVELLLSRGAAVEVKNRKGNSPLWLAAHGGHLPVVEVLNTHGADIDSQDNRRVSCLMAAFRKGHTKVVKWMVQHVTQFPSDQEMTRFINTISDKELMEKCYDCVKIIRAAKEAQAVKANKNASILLEELDMERTREESRRAAAARRRERKKKKKMEKKEEKRKMLESNNIEPSLDKESEKDEDSDNDKEEMNAESNQNQDREEGDSGIDQGSCSSTDMKAANAQAEKNNKSKKKQKKNNVTSNQPASSNRGSSSPLLEQQEERVPPKKKEEVNNNTNRNKKESVASKPEPKKPLEKPQEIVIKKEEPKKKEILNKDISIKNKEKEKENLAPKDDTRQTKITEKKPETSTQIQKQHLNQELPTALAVPSLPTNRKSLIFSARHPVEKDDSNGSLNTSKLHRHHDDIKVNCGKSMPIGTKRGEDGWKEVVRKSSIQQQTVASASPLVEMTCKKVQVPVHAISRVIGRAGSNINAIRASTGAHIEVEKQGKAQSDRCITIKGLSDATKQAFVLITALIKDPDVDILQMLPRPNISAKPAPLVVNSWDKNSPIVTQSVAVSSSSSSVSSSSASVKSGKPIQVSSSSSKTVTTTMSTVGNKTIVSLQSRAPGSKQGFLPSQSSRTTTTVSSSIGSQNRSVGESSSGVSAPKRILSSTSTASQSLDSLNSGTKTTMSYTNAIMSLKNAALKSSSTTSSTSQQSAGTFASKLTANGEKKNQSVSQSSTQNSTHQMPSSFHSSPKHNSAMYYDVNLMPPSRKMNMMKQGLPSAFTSSADTDTNTSVSTGRSVTPIGPPFNVNRNISSSPLLSMPLSSANDSITTSSALSGSSSSMTMQPPGGIVNQLQTKISQEYSLFDSASDQWETKQMYGPGANESLPKIDASKAPGYNRGNVMSSPVSSKTSSNSTTPPSSSMQQQGQNLTILPVSAVSATSPRASHSSASQSSVVTQVVPEVYTTAANDLNCALKSSQPAINPSPSSGLAIQRPIMNNMPNRGGVTSQIDNYGPIGSNVIREQNQQTSRNYFEQVPSLNLNQPHSMNYPDNLQHYPPHMGVNQANPLQISRLNPRASVFSQQNKSSQQLGGGIFHQNNSNIGLNSYQKVPVGSQNVNNNNIPPYNQPPGRPQSQPQAGTNRWFPSADYASYMSRDILENAISSASPAMSPNNPHPRQSQTNGIQPQPSSIDDERKMPRPIGTERAAASWKNFYPHIIDQQQEQLQQQQQQQQQQTIQNTTGTMHQWMIEKPVSNWNKRYYGDPHHQDHYRLPDHYSIPPSVAVNPAINIMPPLQYPHFIGHTDMSQMPDKLELWDNDQHSWSSNWTN